MNNMETDIKNQLLKILLNSTTSEIELWNPDKELRESIDFLFRKGYINEINVEHSVNGLKYKLETSPIIRTLF